MTVLRAFFAVSLARIAAGLSRLLGHGGSSFPGAVARRLDPNVLRTLAGRLGGGALLVTGTNGKTTSALFIEHILAHDGRAVVRNRSGANLIVGLTATLMAAVSWSLRLRADWAVLETDEASIPRAVDEVHPRLLAVTNFFRDQLDRYGELTTTVNLVGRGVRALPPDGTVVLNADDPYAASLGRERGDRVIYFGLGSMSEGADGIEETLDARFCPLCGGELRYARRFYAHLGHWRCGECGFSRPHPAVEVTGVSRDAVGERTVALRVDRRTLRVTIALPGTYNLYNAAMAVAVSHALGVGDTAIQAGLSDSQGAFGRMETVIWRGREVRLALVKNPTGFNQVLRAVAEDPRPKVVMVAINDRYADGRDVSWLWDVDFETLTPRVGATTWIAAGVRARDMAVRLKYAGVRPDLIRTAGGSPEEALGTLQALPDPSLCYVLPTYTAMMELRGAFERQGLVASFVEG